MGRFEREVFFRSFEIIENVNVQARQHIQWRELLLRNAKTCSFIICAFAHLHNLMIRSKERKDRKLLINYRLIQFSINFIPYWFYFLLPISHACVYWIQFPSSYSRTCSLYINNFSDIDFQIESTFWWPSVVQQLFAPSHSYLYLISNKTPIKPSLLHLLTTSIPFTIEHHFPFNLIY